MIAGEELVDGAHFFLMEGVRHVFTSPFGFVWRGLERFVAVFVGGDGEKWLVAKGSGVLPREVFCAPRRQVVEEEIGSLGNTRSGANEVAFLDREEFGADERIVVTVVGGMEEADVALRGALGEGRELAWAAGDGAVVAIRGRRFVKGSTEEAEAAVREGADRCAGAGVGRFEEEVGEDLQGMEELVAVGNARETGGGRGRVLFVHYRSLAVQHADAPGLAVAGVRYGSVCPPVTEMDVSVCEAVGAVAVFRVDMELYSDEELEGGLRLTLVGKEGRQVSAGVLWEKERDGMAVVFVDRDRRLLRLDETMFSVLYHRLDSFEDWMDWELWMWIRQQDIVLADGKCEERGGTEDGREVKVAIKPRLVDGDVVGCGRVAFDLSMAVGLAPNATLRVEPVKVSRVDAGAPEDVGDGDKGCKVQDYTNVIKRDVSRFLRLNELKAATGAETMFRRFVHFAQADERVLFDAPVRSLLEARRFVELEYRRYAGDTSGWDLWCWDDTDAPATGHSVKLESREPADKRDSVAFIVDRAAFGGGSSVRVLPRLGGERWVQKDEPHRLIPAPDCDIQERQSFFTSEGMGLMLNSMEEARKLLRAHVQSEGRVQICSAVPFEWLVGQRALVPEVLVLEKIAKDVPAARWTSAEKRSTLAAVNVERSGPVSLALSLQMTSGGKDAHDMRVNSCSSTVILDEDFCVENSVVSLPGFDLCPLTWQMYDDWDSNFYTGELGWDYSTTRCHFRCFAPTADVVFVVLYDAALGGNGKRIAMRRIPEGCWKATVNGDLKGSYYKLLAEGSNKRLFPGCEVIDPYSRCNTSHTGRGLIFGEENTPVAPRPDIKPENTIIYELHLRDATVDPKSGVVNKGKYMGLTETGTRFVAGNKGGASGSKGTLAPVSTALDHIVDMGVTAVQIMPIQDFDNDENDPNSYRWGYMPVHYFSPDGWYASKTDSVARVTEAKLLVDALHKAGLKVILDVVYNHTAEDGNELNLDARFSFNGLAPRYYYRNCLNTPFAHTGDSTCSRNASGKGINCGTCVSNGSGCGNEFRSESRMGRKFILDSLKYWANEYKVDGFRFDLLGLIDVETMSIVASELRDIDPNIVVYGEPWCGGLTPIKSTEKGMQRSRGFSVFNNSFRDALRGSPFGIEETFVMDGCRLDAVKRGIIGSIDEFTDSPLETINYVECHDNYTLWDHFKFYIGLRSDDITFSDSDLVRMHKLSAAIIFTSQGIPMIQIGQEMCRSKFGEENSYESPDHVNMVRWESKLGYSHVVSYYRGLITLRRSHPELFCMTDQANVRERITFFEDMELRVPPQCIAYLIRAGWGDAGERGCMNVDVERWTEVVVLFNAQPCAVSFELPEKSTIRHWIAVVNADTAGVDSIGRPVCGSLEVPGRSAAVLRRASDDENARAMAEIRLDYVTDPFAFPVDEVPSPYAVGLALNRTESEQQDVEELIRQRDAFLSGSKCPASSCRGPIQK